ncbi:MAG: ACT domain-containing protein [Deltaproteobacteria bacterium]|nr:ACT domain-containing protein [Deltaproteobacteria bacterium]MBW2306201.1 ACT domain-containing protein [Deltaproteobacteria bacterium]
MKQTVEQISVFIENRPGRLAEITRTLGNAGVNIRALTLADTTDFGILRLIVSDVGKAVEALKTKNFPVGKTEVVAIEVIDRPGGLASILDILHQADINVEYMYAFLERHQDNAVIIFRFDDIDQAISVLEEKGINVLTGQMVYQR